MQTLGVNKPLSYVHTQWVRQPPHEALYLR